MGSTIGLIIVALILGVIIGKLDTILTDNIRGGQSEKKIKTLTEEIEVLKARLAQRPAAVAPPSLLRVNTSDGQTYSVELEGEKIDPASITTAQRTRLVSIIVAIRPWIDAKSAPPAAPVVAAPAPAPAPVITPPASLPVTPAVLPSRPAVLPIEAEPKLDVMRGARTFLENSVLPKQVDTSGMSIIRRINDYMQKKLVGSPYAAMGISLEDGPYGSVMVIIGLNKFDGVDNVPDAGIQAFIRETIAEWNKHG